MAIAFVGAGSISVTTTETSVTITSPACSVGDIMIACVASRGTASNTISAPAGWSQLMQRFLDHTTNTYDSQYAIFWKVATSSGESFIFTKATDDNAAFGGVIGVWTGQDADNPIDATTPALGETTVSAQDNISFGAFDPTSTSNHTIFVAFYSEDQVSFSAAMSNDTNPDCTTRFSVENAAGEDFAIAATSGSNDGSNIAARTWASNSVTDAGNAGVVFALREPVASTSTSISSSPSTSPSSSPSVSTSLSTSVSSSISSSPSISISSSLSTSPSTSISSSISSSLSTSPSTSISSSISSSPSPSTSISASPSSSISDSPSSSISDSPSSSISDSPSTSISTSISTSVSSSPSISISSSVSSSISDSPSTSPSISISSSPSNSPSNSPSTSPSTSLSSSPSSSISASPSPTFAVHYRTVGKPTGIYRPIKRPI